MRTMPLSEAKDKLSGLVEAVEATHETITITRHGHPAAVLMSADDLESLNETLFWLSQPGILDDIAEGEQAIREGRTYSLDQVRAELGLPPK